MNYQRSSIIKKSLHRPIFLFAIVVMIFTIGYFSGNSLAADSIEMSWVSFLPSTNESMQGLQKYLFDKINERAKGELVIKYRGGPETIPSFDQGTAVKNGVVDISAVSVGFYEAIAPGIGGAMLTQISLDDERKPGGAYDYLVELHKKGGLFYLGRGAHSEEPYFFLHLNKKVETKEDFSKIRIASATGSRAAVKGWGATHVPVTVTEQYAVMERGVADGLAGVPLVALVGFGIQEVIKYTLDHPYYFSTVAVIMNLNSWNKLPQNLKDIVMKTMIEAEKAQMEQDKIDRAKARLTIAKAGVEFYKLSPDMADWFLKTAYDSAWDYQQQRFPDVTPKLRRLLTK